MRSTPKTLSLYQNWCFTIAGWTDADESQLLALPYTYLIYSKELTPLSGTPQLQGYVQLKSRVRLTTLAQLLPRFLWVTGCLEPTQTYCKKQSSYIEHGTPTVGTGLLTSSERKLRTKRCLDPTVSLEDIAVQELLSPYIVRTLSTVRDDLHQDTIKRQKTQPKSSEIKHEWHYNGSYTNTIQQEKDLHPDAYVKALDVWWCNYKGEDTVIVQCLSSTVSRTMTDCLCKWASPHQFVAQVKGGSLGLIRPSKIIVTSSFHPSIIWPDSDSLHRVLTAYTIHYVQPQQSTTARLESIPE